MAIAISPPADYRAALQALLPVGHAWPRAQDATLTRLLAALAEELARVDGRASTLLEESDPRTAIELFPDWERIAGLPDACLGGTEQSMGQRRELLLARLTTVGGQSIQYYINIAALFGIAINSITEIQPHDVTCDVTYPLYGEDWQFVWQVDAPENSIGYKTVTDTVADPLAWWGNEALECLINRLKPAHTQVLFAYY
jgi:uncharacterized protein YmfQ (DUF2313 family)